MRKFLWVILLTQVHANGNMFQKIIQHILSNFSYEAAWSWNQSFVISRSWNNFSSKDTKKHVPNLWCKHTFWKTLNRKSRDTAIISGEIWSSCLKISKVTILKKCVKFPKNCLWQSSPRNILHTQPAILI